MRVMQNVNPSSHPWMKVNIKLKCRVFLRCRPSYMTHFFCIFLHVNSFLFAYTARLAAMTVLSSITCCWMRVLIFRDISACPLIIHNRRRCYVAASGGSIPRRFVLSDRHRPHRDRTVRRSVSLETALKVLRRHCRSSFVTARYRH